MHEITRRNLCRLAFLLFCLLPTAGVLTLVLYRHSPIHRGAERRGWEQVLFQRLGLLANIGRVAHGQHGVVALEGIELSDPETGQRLARLRVLELAETDHGQVLLASQPEIDAGQFLRLWQVLHDRVLRGPPLSGPVQLLSREVTLRGQNGQTFTDVECTLAQHESGTQVVIDFRVAGVPSQSTSQLQVLRNRQLSPPATGWQLRTGSASLPCSIFAAYLPLLERLGPSCRFSGTAWADKSTRGWNGEIAGRFTEVDLDRLMEPFPHKLSGTAEIVFQQARFQDGRLEQAAGSIKAEEGVISRGLVEALGQALKLEVKLSSDDNPEPLLTYQQLALGYELNDTKLRVSGTCEAVPRGTILIGATGPLLADVAAETVPAVALARALSPRSEFLVPATKETGLLVGALPIPTGAAAETVQAQRHVPLRLRKE